MELRFNIPPSSNVCNPLAAQNPAQQPVKERIHTAEEPIPSGVRVKLKNGWIRAGLQERPPRRGRSHLTIFRNRQAEGSNRSKLSPSAVHGQHTAPDSRVAIRVLSSAPSSRKCTRGSKSGLRLIGARTAVARSA